MYIVLVNDDNSLYGSQKCCIMHRSNCVDTLTFVVNPIYKGVDMTDATVMLEYLLPISKKYKTEYLTLSEERYKDCFLQYKLPFTTKFTSEHGDVKVQLTFIKVELDENGNSIQRVRKTSSTTIKITPIEAWSDIIPDEALQDLDQRIIMQTAQIKALNELANALDKNKVDNLVYNEKSDSLQLMAGNKVVGNKVSVKDMIDDGIPVIDLDSDDESNTKPEGICDCGCEHEDNVVEFGDLEDSIVEKFKDDNVVEF